MQLQHNHFSNVLVRVVAAAICAQSIVPVWAGQQPVLQSMEAHSDTTTASDRPNPKIATASPHTFKLNAGITQEYVLGPGDVLSITDLAPEDERGSTVMTPVLPDGTVIISYAGVIEAAGMSLRDMNQLVNDKAKKWFKNPQLMVNLAKQRSTQVYLLGDVMRPGLYSADSKGGEDEMSSGGGGGGSAGGSSGGSASTDDAAGGGGGSAPPKLPATSSVFTLSSALALAGGLKESADIRHIHVTRQHPKQVIDIDLWKLMLDGDVTEDIVLQPGDVVYVPKGGSQFDASQFGKVASNTSKVRVIGAVKSPGLLMMNSDDDLISVIAKAGGFTNIASSRFVTIARTNRDGTVTQEKVKFKDAIKKGSVTMERIKVHPGDVVVVRTSAIKATGYTVGRVMPQMMMSAVSSMLLFRIDQNGTTTTR